VQVEAVPKFSKFIHGCATLLPERVELVPFWLPQMEMDIRRDPGSNAKVFIERPTSANQSSNSNPSVPSSPPSVQEPYMEPVSEGEDDEPFTQTSQNEEKRLGLPPAAYKDAQEAKAFREQKLQAEAANGSGAQSYGDRNDAGAAPVANGQRVMRLDARNLRKLLMSSESQAAQHKQGDDEADGEGQGEGNAQEVEYVRTFKAPAGKKISMPVRVEPKVSTGRRLKVIRSRCMLMLCASFQVYFANEVRYS
jgi:hypothetical protein